MPNPVSKPGKEDERFLVRLAWACEIEGLTQAQAAQRFGVTRLRVNKALNEARRRGIVSVQINSEYATCTDIEIQLKEKYQLSDAHVAPVISETERPVKELIGSYLASYLNRLLADNSVKRFGMSWGTTLNHALPYMKPMNRPDLEVVSTMGCVTRSSDVNIIESTRLLANLCGAQKSYFTAPLYATSTKSRNLLLKQDVFREMLDRILSVDALAMTVGDVSALSQMIKDGLPDSVSVDELINAGAVGDALGYYLDKHGRPITHSINGCVLGMELSDLKEIPNIILASGGKHKEAIIRAVLKLGWVDTLITDQKTAQALLTST